jgi:hypothetical protein
MSGKASRKRAQRSSTKQKDGSEIVKQGAIPKPAKHARMEIDSTATPPPPPKRKRATQPKNTSTVRVALKTPIIACFSCGQTGVPLLMGGRELANTARSLGRMADERVLTRRILSALY